MRHVVPGDNSKTCSTALDIITHLLNHPKNSEYAKQVGYAASLCAVCDSTSSLFPKAAGATQNTHTPHGGGRSDKVVALATECLSKIGALFALPTSVPFVEHLVRRILRCGRYMYIHTYIYIYICVYV